MLLLQAKAPNAYIGNQISTSQAVYSQHAILCCMKYFYEEEYTWLKTQPNQNATRYAACVNHLSKLLQWFSVSLLWY